VHADAVEGLAACRAGDAWEECRGMQRNAEECRGMQRNAEECMSERGSVEARVGAAGVSSSAVGANVNMEFSVARLLLSPGSVKCWHPCRR
jgi:hypothetical protein